MDNAPVKAGDVIAGKYRVERVLGEGGMGVVVSAHHLELEQRVAVKFLLAQIAKHADAAERFRREARAAVKIRSEHVVRVIDVGTTEDGVPYMVMEHLDGHDLADELRERGALPIEEAVSWVLQACEAVAEAHAAGIVHRDLKPANLFLAKRADGTILVKVLDFGISKSVGGGSASDLSLTSTTALMGSPLYMSPEHMSSAKNVDARTDIWSLGAILYECLAHRPPFVADSMPALCAQLLSEPHPPLSSFRQDVPPALVEVIDKALAKDRLRRWNDVGELAMALVPFAPEARVHAARAARVVAASDVKISTASPAGGPAPSVATGFAKTEPLAVAPTMAVEPKTADRTFDSWGKTEGRTDGTVPPKPARRWLPIVGAGALVAGAVIAIGFSRMSATADPNPTPEPAAQPQPVPRAVLEPLLASPEPSASAPSAPPPSASAAASAPRKDKPSPTVSPKPAPSAKPGPGASDFGGRR